MREEKKKFEVRRNSLRESQRKREREREDLILVINH